MTFLMPFFFFLMILSGALHQLLSANFYTYDELHSVADRFPRE